MLKCKPTSRSPRPQNKWWRVDFKSEAGITLVELLAVLALLSIIIALVGSAHMFGQKQYRKQAAIASQSNELTIALATMTRELRNLKANQVEVKEGAILIDGVVTFSLIDEELRSKEASVIAQDIQTFTATKSTDNRSLTIVLIGKNGTKYETMISFRGG